jgi:hypothetical protein
MTEFKESTWTPVMDPSWPTAAAEDDDDDDDDDDAAVAELLLPPLPLAPGFAAVPFPMTDLCAAHTDPGRACPRASSMDSCGVL